MTLRLSKETVIALSQEEGTQVNVGILKTRKCHSEHEHHCEQSKHHKHHCHTNKHHCHTHKHHCHTHKKHC